MPGRECYHCKARIEPEDLRDAWERIRATAAAFGEQRIYASGKAIMFARTRCYFFVRPRVHSLEVCVFLGRTVTSPLVRRADGRSRTKVAHTIAITHRDQVEAPFTDWLHEAYETSDALSAAPTARAARAGTRTARKRPTAKRKSVKSARSVKRAKR